MLSVEGKVGRDGRSVDHAMAGVNLIPDCKALLLIISMVDLRAHEMWSEYLQGVTTRDVTKTCRSCMTCVIKGYLFSAEAVLLVCLPI